MSSLGQEDEKMEINFTGFPRYLPEIGAPKLDSQITIFFIKKTRDDCKLENKF